MADNSKFNDALAQSGLSMYALSKRSGVPYTSINEIHNGKNDINQCAASTVWRLAAALGVLPEDLINEIHFLDGIGGKYNGIRYTWSSGDSSLLNFTYSGETVTLDAGVLYNIPSRLDYYSIFACWMIKEFIEHKQWEEQAKSRIERRSVR